jgi:hypothetical protein
MTRFFSSAPYASAGPNPTDEHNRCDLKPGTPRMSGKALFLVCPRLSLPLYVVCFGLPRFAWQNGFPTRRPGPIAGAGSV